MRLAVLAAFLGLFSVAAAAQDWNLRTSPLGLAVGIANLRLDYRTSDQWVIGPEVALLNREVRGVDLKAFGYGLVAMYYFTTAYEDSAFMEVSASTSKIRASSAQNTSGQEHIADFTNNQVRLLAGYHWFWERLNVSLGGGLATNSAGDVKIKDTSGNEVDNVRLNPVTLALDFTLGFRF